jgi:flagellar biosynthesis/type III secretory pathway protein FliH
VSKQCICCGKEIPDSEYNFICDFCKMQQMRIEENFRKRLRYAYDEGKAAGYKLAVKDILLQVKTIIDNADTVVDNTNQCWQPEVGYNKRDIDIGFVELCKHFEVEL